MLFLPISFLLVALAVGLSLLNKVERPLRANWLPIMLVVGQAAFLFWLVDQQKAIGCPTMLGEYYVQHENLMTLQMLKFVFALGSWVYWLYLGVVILLRCYRLIKFKGESWNA